MKEKRSIITMDGQGNIALPTDTVSIAMTEWEQCEKFGVIAPTIRAGIKALCKSGVLREYETKHTIKLSDKRSMEVYSLEAIIALAFRINTFGAAQVRSRTRRSICFQLCFFGFFVFTAPNSPEVFFAAFCCDLRINLSDS